MIRLILALWAIKNIPGDYWHLETAEAEAGRAARAKALTVLNRWLS